LSAPAALAFLLFQVFFIPCVGTLAALYQETKSLRWTGLSVGIMLFLSSSLAFAVYHIGSLL
jgi:ferrous iron transport protein B